MFSVSFLRWTPLALATIGLCVGLAGCGDGGDSTKRFDVSGAVTFDGKPVPSGTILFEPDSGNRGPAGFAQIRDGKYDTSVGGKGTVGGPHVARLSGADKTALFSDYVVKVDLPQQQSTKDFEVPASAKAPPESRPGPGYQGP